MNIYQDGKIIGTVVADDAGDITLTDLVKQLSGFLGTDVSPKGNIILYTDLKEEDLEMS